MLRLAASFAATTVCSCASKAHALRESPGWPCKKQQKRSASTRKCVMLHFAVSLGDAFDHLARGRVDKAAGALFTRANLRSARAVADHGRVLARMATLG